MVSDYRDSRAAQIEAAGGWRNEDAHRGAVVFKTWLQVFAWEVSSSVDTDVSSTVA